MGLDTIFHKRSFAFFSLSLLIISIYSNTFYASWHLDDRPNIVNNYFLHLNSLHPEKLINTLFTDPRNPEFLNDKPYRPVACLTFALNWYLGQDHVVGYHIVNTLIHILTAFTLFLFILRLFATPRLKNHHRGDPFLIALLASLLWAVNPIQTQAVTYIVQRMAQFAACFYLLGLVAYLKARLSQESGKKVFWFASCVGCYLLGVYSKPNAAMLPLAIILVEIAFFQNLTDEKTVKKVILIAVTMAAFIVIFGSVLYLRGNPLSFIDLYHTRTFTLWERLLTQPRVILFYLSQLFFPLPDRLSIAHDIAISSSLLKPWTTLPSMAIVITLIGFSVFQINKRPIAAFAILFFFLNHIVESSFIGLEMIFEHRNYLPSFFLFLPLASLFNHLILAHHNRKKAIIASMVVLVSFFSVSTYIRNQAWKNDVTLWTDAIEKAPKNSRASHTLANILAWGDSSAHPNRYDMALKLYENALKGNLPRKNIKAEIYGNMALVYSHHKGDAQKAYQYFDKALETDPDNLKIRRNYTEALVLDRAFEKALHHVDTLLLKNSDNGRYHRLKGHILLWQKKYEAALSSYNTAYPLIADKSGVLLSSAVALSLAGHYSNAEKVLLEAIKHFPAMMPLYFAIIENSIRANAEGQVSVYTQKLMDIYTIQEINQGLKAFSDNPRYAPLHAGPMRRILENLKTETAGGS